MTACRIKIIVVMLATGGASLTLCGQPFDGIALQLLAVVGLLSL